jgi:hypothetical protein
VYRALKAAADDANMDTRVYIHWVIEQLWAPRADKVVPPKTAVDGHGRPLEYKTKDGARYKRRCSLSHEAHELLEKHAAAAGGWAKSSYARWILEDWWMNHRPA